jgi:hypothetical protein
MNPNMSVKDWSVLLAVYFQSGGIFNAEEEAILQRLIKQGLVIESAGKYFLTPRGMRIL